MDGERRRPRWWQLAAAIVTAWVVAWLLASTWSAIRGSHPAYLVTLVAIGLIAVGVAVWAVRSKSTRPGRWFGRVALVLATAATVGVLVYLRPLPADGVAIDALADDERVDVSVSASRIRFDPIGEPRAAGLVFYPGAKVDPRAYARILRPLAEDGYTVVILKVPYNIAFFSPAAAGSVVGADDDIDRWVIGGHSLGGVVAARVAAAGDAETAGLLLWGSFPARGIAGSTDLDVLSVSGSNDGLATPADIEASRPDLPPGSEFVVVEGAIHAHFGDYGSQQGDGEPGMSRDDAQAAIVAATRQQLGRVS